MNVDATPALRNWIPYKLFFEEKEPLCRWLFVGENEFTEPFFDETILKCRADGPNRSMKSVSSLEVLPALSESIEAIKPSAFIFHISRCGSTLACQLLSLNPCNIVLSEVPFFDELLRYRIGGSEEYSPGLLKAAISFYGMKRKNNQDRLVIKTDSWHIFFYSRLRKLYPGVPFILLYRRPDEVDRSQQKRKGMQAVPGLIEPELFGFDKNDIDHIPREEYMFKVLEKYFAAFLNILKKDPLAFPINYNEGAIAIVKKIAALSGILITGDEIKKMQQRAHYHAKYPEQIFSEEPVKTPLPSYCARAFELYYETEKIRNGRV